MDDERTGRPTPGELTILKVLWARGPSTVREVQEALGHEEEVGYTTALKLLQIMLEKGLVERDESARAHVYRAAVAEAETERRLLNELRDRAFGGSTARLVMRALADAPATDRELEEIRSLLDRVRGEAAGGARRNGEV